MNTDSRTGVPLVGQRNASIELDSFITLENLEAAYIWCKVQMEVADGEILALKGWRAAEARNPKLLKALDKGAELMVKLAEDQYGRTMRDPGSSRADKSLPTEAQFWREAYVTCDRGTPVKEFSYIYACAAKLAGLIQ